MRVSLSVLNYIFFGELTDRPTDLIIFGMVTRKNLNSKAQIKLIHPFIKLVRRGKYPNIFLPFPNILLYFNPFFRTLLFILLAFEIDIALKIKKSVNEIVGITITIIKESSYPIY